MDPSTTHAASKLTVSGGPIRSVTVVPDPTLAGRIALELRADVPAEVAAVTTRTKGGRLVVDVPSPGIQVPSRRGLLDRILRRATVTRGDLVGGRVHDGRERRPTLDLALRVPPDCAVRLDLSGQATATVGDLAANLRLELSGAVRATAGAVLAARIEASGDARAAIASTCGDLRVDLTGSARVEVAHARAGNLALSSTGSSVLGVREGELGEARAEMCGASVASIDAIVTGDLAFEGSGAFKADFAKVLGRTATSRSGSGRIRIGGRSVPAG